MKEQEKLDTKKTVPIVVMFSESDVDAIDAAVKYNNTDRSKLIRSYVMLGVRKDTKKAKKATKAEIAEE